MNLFKKISKKFNETQVSQLLNTRTTNQIIDKIHNEFYSEVDKLLNEAKVSKSIDTIKQDLLDKSKRLKALGFANTVEIEEADKEFQRLQLLRDENYKKKALIEAINYFSQKYINYKFITFESIQTICKKYNLIFATADRFKGKIPNYNLKEIENFKIEEIDECYTIVKTSSYSTEKNTYYGNIKVLDEINKKNNECEGLRYSDYYRANKSQLIVVAPSSDFDTTNMELKDFELSPIHIPDPIVIKPVFYKEKRYGLIVTAWGQEASDEIVINQKMN